MTTSQIPYLEEEAVCLETMGEAPPAPVPTLSFPSFSGTLVISSEIPINVFFLDLLSGVAAAEGEVSRTCNYGASCTGHTMGKHKTVWKKFDLSLLLLLPQHVLVLLLPQLLHQVGLELSL